MIWMLVSALLASVSQIFLKSSALKEERSGIKVWLNWEVCAGYALLALSLFCNIVAYQTLPYKWGPVIASLSYILVPLLSRHFFKERLTPLFLLGMALILGGIFIFGL